MNLYYIIAALFVLFGGILVVAKGHQNKPLKLLSFFMMASMIRPVTDSHWAWVVELVFIFYFAKLKKSLARDCLWYLLFLALAFISLLYSTSPVRGIPGMVMYVFPLLYYALATTAFKKATDVSRFFHYISGTTWLLLLFCVASLFNNYIVFSYYGMSICTIPVFLFIKTKKKKYIIHFLLCLFPAFILVKRTPLLGIAGAMMMFAFLIFKWKALVPSVLSIALGIFIVLSIPSFRAKLFFDPDITSVQDISRNGVENVNVNGRINFWGIVLDRFYSQSPVIGTGMGTVKAYLQSDQNEFRSDFSLMHNDWLLVLCEQGLLGVILLVLFMMGILIKCIKYAANRYPKELRLVSAVCAGSVVSTMIHMFFENCMNSFVFSSTFVFYAIFKTCIHEYPKSQISR